MRFAWISLSSSRRELTGTNRRWYCSVTDCTRTLLIVTLARRNARCVQRSMESVRGQQDVQRERSSFSRRTIQDAPGNVENFSVAYRFVRQRSFRITRRFGRSRRVSSLVTVVFSSRNGVETKAPRLRRTTRRPRGRRNCVETSFGR